MALTAKERAMIQQLVDRQMALERFIGDRFGLMTGAGVRVSQQDIFNSPLVFDREERIDILTKGASISKRAGQRKRRKVSAYQKEFGRQLKKLKAKHKRTPISKLMRKAHIATRKVRK